MVQKKCVIVLDTYDEYCRSEKTLFGEDEKSGDFIAIDSENRICESPEDFLRTKEANSFPVSVYGNFRCCVCNKKLDDRNLNHRMNGKKLVRLCNECVFKKR